MEIEDRYYHVCNKLIALKQEFEPFRMSLHRYKQRPYELQSKKKRDELEIKRFQYDTTICSMTMSLEYYENEMRRLGIQFQKINY